MKASEYIYPGKSELFFLGVLFGINLSLCSRPEVPDPQAETASLSTATSEIPDLSIVKRVQGIIGKVRRPWSVKWAKSKR
jgi:hypothetical protein